MAEKIKNKKITTSEAAKILGVNSSRVRQFLADGRIPGEKLGKNWMLDLKKVMIFNRIPRNTGIPILGEKFRKARWNDVKE